MLLAAAGGGERRAARFPAPEEHRRAALLDGLADEVALADSIGIAVPADVAQRLWAVRELTGPTCP